MNFLTQLLGGNTTEVDVTAVNQRRSETPGPLLLDVREPSEFSAGHIPGAQLMPLGTLPQKMSQLPKEREIICICHSGNRSSFATRQLRAAGYQATNLRGGMLAWQRAQLPIQKGKR